MAAIDIVIPTYRGLPIEANQPLISMMQGATCYCHDSEGMRMHDPWKCPKGKHHPRMNPPIHASSVVHWSRNQSIARAMYGLESKDGRPEPEYFLLMDDDMVAEPHYLTRLASYKLDIVTGIATIRRDPVVPNIRFWDKEKESWYFPVEWEWDAQRLMEVDGAGAAFMLVKRKVFERMEKAWLNCEFELAEDFRKTAKGQEELIGYWMMKSALRKKRFTQGNDDGDWSAMDCYWFQFMNNTVDSGVVEIGEDVGFCWKAKKLGFKIFADPQVLPGHLGTYAYSIRDYRERIEESKKLGTEMPLAENHVGVEPDAVLVK